MGKHWARQQVRQDEVKDSVDHAMHWVATNRQKALTIGGSIAGALLLVGLVVWQRGAAASSAWERLSFAQSLAYAGKADESMSQLNKLAEEQPGSDAAKYAGVFAGDMMFQQGKSKEAAAQYQKMLDGGLPKTLEPVTLNDLAIAQEAGGQPQLAVQAAQRFLDAYPDHFLAPQVHACLARSLQALGQAEQAKAAFQKIALQYPETSWAGWAQAKLKGS